MSFIEHMHNAVNRARSNGPDAGAETSAFASKRDVGTQYVDLSIHFIGASGLPKMDVVGSADPYFVAQLDDKIKYISTVKPNTLSPVWNEMWFIKNVPVNATLNIQVLDKDNGPTDDFIGKFSVSTSSGAKEAEIEGPILKRTKGTFWLKIDVNPPTNPEVPPYTFDGPIRFSRHFSPAVGRLTNINDERLYSTWKMYIKGVPIFFGDTVQHWNRSYRAAQSIFGAGPASLAVRSSIQAGHRMLYARSTRNSFGVITRPEEVMSIFQGGKLALGSQSVRYSGEFHPRPEGGWTAFSEDTPDDQVRWELVIDNNSGTYAPDKAMLPKLKQCLEYNFPGFTVYALDRDDPELSESREACRAYALKYRGVRQDELQPHAKDGEETLSHQALAVPSSEYDEPPTPL